MGALGKFPSATIGSVLLLLPHNPAEHDCINKSEDTVRIEDSFIS